jgi:hypothetical protein
MTATPEDLAYASYMLSWIEKLDWPQLSVADEALPQLQAYWRDSVDTDLDAISDRLWTWVDANGGPQPSPDKQMILVRMLICLAAVPNRELEKVGFFEQLLRNYGVADEEVARARPRKPFDGAAVANAQPAAAPSARAGTHEQQKMQVLLAFAAVSFFAGANPVIAMSADLVRLVELGLVFAMVFLIFLWYRIDADQRGFQRSIAVRRLVGRSGIGHEPTRTAIGVRDFQTATTGVAAEASRRLTGVGGSQTGCRRPRADRARRRGLRTEHQRCSDCGAQKIFVVHGGVPSR